MKLELVLEESSYDKHSSIPPACLVIFEGKRERVDRITDLQIYTISLYTHLIGL